MKRLLVLSVFAVLGVATQSEARVRAIGSFNTPKVSAGASTGSNGTFRPQARAIGSFTPQRGSVYCAKGPSEVCIMSKHDVPVSAGGFCQTCE